MARQQRTFCSTSEKVIHVMYSTLIHSVYLHTTTSWNNKRTHVTTKTHSWLWQQKLCLFAQYTFHAAHTNFSLSRSHTTSRCCCRSRVAARQHSKQNMLSQSKSTHNCNLCRNLLGNLFAIWYGFAIKKKERKKKNKTGDPLPVIVICVGVSFGDALALEIPLRVCWFACDICLSIFLSLECVFVQCCVHLMWRHLSAPKHHIHLIAVY